MPSMSANDPEEVSLARFAYRMKCIYNGRKDGQLTEEQIRVLSGIPGWSWYLPPKQLSLNERFEELEKYVRTTNTWPTNKPETRPLAKLANSFIKWDNGEIVNTPFEEKHKSIMYNIPGYRLLSKKLWLEDLKEALETHKTNKGIDQKMLNGNASYFDRIHSFYTTKHGKWLMDHYAESSGLEWKKKGITKLRMELGNFFNFKQLCWYDQFTTYKFLKNIKNPSDCIRKIVYKWEQHHKLMIVYPDHFDEFKYDIITTGLSWWDWNSHDHFEEEEVKAMTYIDNLNRYYNTHNQSINSMIGSKVGEIYSNQLNYIKKNNMSDKLNSFYDR